MDEEEEFAIDRDLDIRVHSTQVAIVVEIITILFDISKKFLYIVEDKKDGPREEISQNLYKYQKALVNEQKGIIYQ